MGMFDSLYTDNGTEWQTKAFNCELDTYRVGDKVHADLPETYPTAYQVAILGGTDDDPYQRSFATVRDGRVASIDDSRDSGLPVIDYFGHLQQEVN